MTMLASLATWSIMSVVVLAMAWLATKFAKRNAATRHLIWVFAFVGLLLIPVFCRVVPGRVIRTKVYESPYEVEISPEIELAPEPKPFDWTPVGNLAIGLWAMGLTLFFGFLIRGAVLARGMKRHSDLRDPIAFGCEHALSKADVTKPWELRISWGRRPPAAMTWGWLKPVVMLPQSATEWSPQKCETVLLHELAHVRRNDSLSQMFALAVCAIYWFNPLVWLAARAMRAEAEKAADDRVIMTGVKPSDYAAELLRIASEFGRERQPLTNIGVSIMKQSKIESRILSIVDPTNRRRGVVRLEVISFASVALVTVLALAALRPGTAVAQEANKETSVQQPIFTTEAGADIEFQQTAAEKAKSPRLIKSKRKTKYRNPSHTLYRRVKENAKYHYYKFKVMDGKMQAEKESALEHQKFDLDRAKIDLELSQGNLAVELEASKRAKDFQDHSELIKMTQDQIKKLEMEREMATKVTMTADQRMKFEAEQKRLFKLKLELARKQKSNLRNSADQTVNAELDLETAKRQQSHSDLKKSADEEVARANEVRKNAEQKKADEDRANQGKKRAEEEKSMQNKGGDKLALTQSTISNAKSDTTLASLSSVRVMSQPMTLSVLNLQVVPAQGSKFTRAYKTLKAVSMPMTVRFSTLNSVSTISNVRFQLATPLNAKVATLKSVTLSKPVSWKHLRSKSLKPIKVTNTKEKTTNPPVKE